VRPVAVMTAHTCDCTSMSPADIHAVL
jgi:hypothetical protein